jgi:hypothetical protein
MIWERVCSMCLRVCLLLIERKFCHLLLDGGELEVNNG